MKKGRERSEEAECPICNLLLPLRLDQSSVQACCMKEVCVGCILASEKRGMNDCPFCRTPLPTDDSLGLVMIQKRIDAGDPVAIWHLGGQYRIGRLGLEKDMTRAVALYERAAELGVKEAHYNLGCLYDKGIDVERNGARRLDITRQQRCVATFTPDSTLHLRRPEQGTMILHCSTG